MTVMVPVWIRCILEERPTSGILCTRCVPPSCFRCPYTLSPAILTAAWCKPPETQSQPMVDLPYLNGYLSKLSIWIFHKKTLNQTRNNRRDSLDKTKGRGWIKHSTDTNMTYHSQQVCSCKPQSPSSYKTQNPGTCQTSLWWTVDRCPLKSQKEREHILNGGKCQQWIDHRLGVHTICTYTPPVVRPETTSSRTLLESSGSVGTRALINWEERRVHWSTQNLPHVLHHPHHLCVLTSSLKAKILPGDLFFLLFQHLHQLLVFIFGTDRPWRKTHNMMCSF